MAEARNMESSYWWWFDSHNKGDSNRSPWLQSSLAELNEKTKTMLKLIEEDADSFAQRAEMYYKKRPELISMVEDFYRTHRSLAERYDLIKSEPSNRLLPWSAPLSFTKYRLEKSQSLSDEAYDSYSEALEKPRSLSDDKAYDSYSEALEKSRRLSDDKAYDSYSEAYDGSDMSNESEVDDPEEEQETTLQDHILSETEELMRLREEVKKLTEQNRVQKEEIKQKDEEKREVIRQLSLAVDLLREENVKLRQTKPTIRKKENRVKFNQLKENFFRILFGGLAKSPQPNLIAL